MRLLTLIELVDTPFWKLPHDDKSLVSMVLAQRQQESSDCEVLSEMLDAAAQRLIAYSADPTWSYAQARFLKLKGTAMDRQRQLRDMVQKLAEAFQKEHVDPVAVKPNHFASLSAYHAICLRNGDSRPRYGLDRWCFGLARSLVFRSAWICSWRVHRDQRREAGTPGIAMFTSAL